MGSSDPNHEKTTPRDRLSTSDQPKRTISGPGAADFIASPGGIDTPESDPAKGTRAAADEAPFTGGGRLTPDLDEPRETTERERLPVDTTPTRDR
jgi:hypothetical protein